MKHFSILIVIDKLPKELLEFLDENRDKNYHIKFDFNVPIGYQVSQITINLFGFFLLEYWDTPEERERHIKIFERNENKFKFQQYESLLEEN